MEIKVSVIVPVYNTEKFLEKCIRSIMSQTLKEIEIICINDGSKDSSLEILKKIQMEDERIIIINKKNEGVSIARNIGIAKAKGEYLSFIDSDDWIEKNCYDEMYKKIKDEKADIIVADFFSENFENKQVEYKLDGNADTQISKKTFKKDMVLAKRTGFLCNKLIRREIFYQHRIRYPKNITLGEDFYTLLKILKYSKKIIKINKAYLHYIQHTNNTCKKIDAIQLVRTYNLFEKMEKEALIDKENLKGLKVNFLGWILNKEEFFKLLKNEYQYKKMIEDILNSIKTVNLELVVSRKIKLCVIILKRLNNLYFLKLIVVLYRIYKRIIFRMEKNEKRDII